MEWVGGAGGGQPSLVNEGVVQEGGEGHRLATGPGADFCT